MTWTFFIGGQANETFNENKKPLWNSSLDKVAVTNNGSQI